MIYNRDSNLERNCQKRCRRRRHLLPRCSCFSMSRHFESTRTNYNIRSLFKQTKTASAFAPRCLLKAKRLPNINDDSCRAKEKTRTRQRKTKHIELSLGASHAYAHNISIISKGFFYRSKNLLPSPAHRCRFPVVRIQFPEHVLLNRMRNHDRLSSKPV